MKKILLLGDIHANYPALKAIEKYTKPDRFDHIINTGDFTVYSTFPNETIQWFRERKKTICIFGNTDRRVLRILNSKKLRKPKKKEKRVMYFWTSENLLPENIKYLKSLPEQAGFTLGPLRIGVFHGTCDDPDEELSMSLKFDSLKDFAPESVVKNTPELNQLLELREALAALKGPMSNRPEFRKKIQALIKDEAAREKLLKELKIDE